MDRRRVPVGVLGLTILAHCGSDGITTPSCDSGVTLTVSHGVSPTIAWSPECRAAGLLVEALDGLGTIAWRITTRDQSNEMEPPVRYGIVTVRVVEQIASKPLVIGTTYLVTVISSEPVTDGGVSLGPIGTAKSLHSPARIARIPRMPRTFRPHVRALR